MKKKKLVIAATGASGFPILIQCLKCIRDDDQYESHLVMSKHAKSTLLHETSLTVSDVEALADVVYEEDNIGATLASGSFQTEGMVIVPCSMKTLAGIHSGYGENLILRAADVTIKEHRTLVLAVRESQFSPIHLRNMAELSMVPGIHIIPPMLEFYSHPETIEDLIAHVSGKLLEPFGIPVPRFKEWEGI